MLRRFLSTRIPKPVFHLYSKPVDCSLCDDFKEALEDLQHERGNDFEVKYVDIRQDKELKRLHQYDIPVLVLQGKQNWIMKHRFAGEKLREALDSWHKIEG